MVLLISVRSAPHPCASLALRQRCSNDPPARSALELLHDDGRKCSFPAPEPSLRGRASYEARRLIHCCEQRHQRLPTTMGISQEVCLHHIDHTLAAVPARLISSSTRGMPNPTRPVSLPAPPVSPDSALLSCSSYIIATTMYMYLGTVG